MFNAGGNGMAKKRKKNDSDLFQVSWKVRFVLLAGRATLRHVFQRVVLDEGHIIRNPKTKVAQSVVALKASRRWVLSGTPIVGFILQ